MKKKTGSRKLKTNQRGEGSARDRIPSTSLYLPTWMLPGVQTERDEMAIKHQANE
jgi:hypothetical protein